MSNAKISRDTAEMERDGKATGDLGPEEVASAEGSVFSGGQDILDLQDIDPALNLKMHLVNNVRRVQPWSVTSLTRIPGY